MEIGAFPARAMTAPEAGSITTAPIGVSQARLRLAPRPGRCACWRDHGRSSPSPKSARAAGSSLRRRSRRARRQGSGPRRRRLAARRRASDRRRQGGAQRPGAVDAGHQGVAGRHPHGRRRCRGRRRADARVPLSQARRPCGDQQGPAGPQDRVRGPAARTAATDLRRPARSRLGRPAAADERRRAGPRARTSRHGPGAALSGAGPGAGSTRRGWTPSRAA